MAKQTIYNRFGDKEALFDAMTSAKLADLREQFGNLLDGLPLPDSAPGGELTDFAVRWVEVFVEPTAAALRRLVIAEAAHHPQLLRRWVECGPARIDDGLAGHLARWILQGVFDIADPVTAARQLRTLVTTDPWHQSGFGTLPLADDQSRMAATVCQAADGAVSRRDGRMPSTMP